MMNPYYGRCENVASAIEVCVVTSDILHGDSMIHGLVFMSLQLRFYYVSHRYQQQHQLLHARS